MFCSTWLSESSSAKPFNPSQPNSAMESIKDVGSIDEYLSNASLVGFQASHLGKARELFNEMKNATLFFGFTANLVASGLRGYISKLVSTGYVDAIVTTAGAIEHDVMKSFTDYYIGSFDADDKELHEKGINRIGNIFVKNESYVKLESISYEVFKQFSTASPSELAKAYGEYIAKNSERKEQSFLYHAYKRNIPVFCPGITDGAIGLNAYFYKQRHSFSIDVTKDFIDLANIVLNADKTAALILGGGISKHHIIGANIVRGGLDYAIYITTAVEYDGSLSGARHREAVSWGKIKSKERSITIYGDATIILPLLLHGLI